MSELILSSRTLEPRTFQNLYGMDMGSVSSCDGPQPTRIMANRPYLLSSQPSVFDKTALAQLSNPHIRRDLTALSVSQGGETLSAASQALAPLLYEIKALSARLQAFTQGAWTGLLAR